MKHAIFAAIVLSAMAWTGICSASSDVAAPTIVSPVQQRGDAPVQALLAHAKRIGAVSFDLAALQPPVDAKNTEQRGAWLVPQLHFELFPGLAFDAEGSRIEQDDFGNTTWVGKIDGVEDGTVALTTKGDSVVGRIDLGLSQYLLTGSKDAGFWVSQIDPASYRSAYDDDTAQFLEGLSASHAVTQPNGFTLNTLTAGHTVDVLVLYSSNARTQMGNDPAIFVANLIADDNQSFINSGVDGAFRVVGYQLIPGFTMPVVSGQAAFYQFLAIRNAMSGGVASFSDVPTLLDQYRADIAVMFVDGTRITNGPCGVAYDMGYTNGADSDKVDVVLSTSCAIGDRTFTHEIGHVLSARHEIHSSYMYTPNPFNDDYGYSSISPPFHMIMGEDDGVGGICNFTGCPRINRWSSLSQTYNGASVGTTMTINGTTYSTDMVTVLGTTVPIVAAYRSPVGLSSPSTPGIPTSNYCSGTTHVAWAQSTGTVGWYEGQISTTGPSGPFFQVSKGPKHRLTAYFSTGTWFRVKACNANGCSAYAQSAAPVTGYGCP